MEQIMNPERKQMVKKTQNDSEDSFSGGEESGNQLERKNQKSAQKKK